MSGIKNFEDWLDAKITKKGRKLLEQVVHFLIGGVFGFLLAWAVDGSLQTELILGFVGGFVSGATREFFQNFVQWEGKKFQSKAYIKPDENNNYLDMAIDLVVWTAGGPVGGALNYLIL